MKRQFSLLLDDKGLWWCGGRLTNADIPYHTKHPLLLPSSHPLTSLIVLDAHKHILHNGVKETLTEVRKRFWIEKGRSLVRVNIHHCHTCRRFEGVPFSAPHLHLLCQYVELRTIQRLLVPEWINPLKYGFVFTLVLSLMQSTWISCQMQSTETFIRCLKRFAARRGLPRKFLFDNGKHSSL